MKTIFFKRIILFGLLVVVLGCISTQSPPVNEEQATETTIKTVSTLETIPEKQMVKANKLHWFIPDGMRADPGLMNIFNLARQGILPNIKKMMDQGAYGYSIPTFPSHTPTNFATLLTGTYPEIHGVADGPMHIEGYSLQKPSVGGFSSRARKIPAIWSLLEESGKDVVLLSMPGSTPPELENGITIRGRWGGWGADFHSLIFEKKDAEQRKKLARGSRLFYFGYELTKFIEYSNTSEWGIDIESNSPPLDLELQGHGQIIYAKIIDSTDDSIENYDQVLFSVDGTKIESTLKEGGWSDWIPATYKWNDNDVQSNVRLHVIKLEEDGFFTIRFVVDNLNKYDVKPSEVSDELHEEVGPMIDFVDNFPPQLMYYPEDKKTFLDEMHLSFDWHSSAIDGIYKLYNPDVFIHDIYSPNQMMTGRWWIGYIDPTSSRYNDVSEEQRKELMGEVLDMYKRLDEMVGKMMEKSDDKTVYVLSSDHGAVPVNKWVRLNNLFAEKGWLVYDINPDTGEPIINWEDTKVIYLKMDNVYIDPEGIGEKWMRSSGEEYEKLRDEVTLTLFELEDDNGVKPVRAAIKWEDSTEFLDLPQSRVGDLVIANKAGYGWNEEITADLKLFDVPLKTGYKQAIFSNETKGMWTPFIIVGPGVKKNFVIEEPIQMVDQMPTIMTILGEEIPEHVQGRVLEEILT